MTFHQLILYKKVTLQNSLNASQNNHNHNISSNNYISQKYQNELFYDFTGIFFGTILTFHMYPVFL